MSLSRWDEGSDSDHVTDLNLDNLLVGHGKFLGWQWAKLPRSGREGAVEVRPFPAKKRLLVSEARALLRSIEVEPDDDGNPRSR